MDLTAAFAPRRTPEQVTAHRLTVIGQAVEHLEHTDRQTLLHQLAKTTIRNRFKTDPEALADMLRSITPDSPPGLRYSAFSGAVHLLLAAGKTVSL
ncbi:hypothetical protein ACH4PU_32720 [Streptomyces sp. NPDC021100]|uniref:hypothetical protein n=1 Tax=Streptomyces sp. NPDC021100 TaxID=3365114 RepID=UPI003798417D